MAMELDLVHCLVFVLCFNKQMIYVMLFSGKLYFIVWYIVIWLFTVFLSNYIM